MKRILIAFCLMILVQPVKAETKEIIKLTSPLEVSLGSKDAPITIVEYTSLTCNHCAEFHLNVLPKIREKYIKTGKIRFVIMPYAMDNDALQAFKLVQALPKEKRHMGLTKTFGAQELWMGKDPATLARILGLSNTDSKKALANKGVENAILTCAYKGSKDLNIEATPTFFMAGKKVEGAPTLEEFEASYKEMTKELGKQS